MAIKPNDDFEKYGDLKTFEPDLRQEHSDVIADYLQRAWALLLRHKLPETWQKASWVQQTPAMGLLI
jgi:hypothetical protein